MVYNIGDQINNYTCHVLLGAKGEVSEIPM